MGLKLWLVCELECRQMTQAGSWCSRQKSLSSSKCRLQRALDRLCSLCSKKSSHRFFSAKFRGGLGEGNKVLLQTGHWEKRVCFSVHHCSQQALQKLWLHVRRTGSLNMSRQIGQWRFSADRKAILFLQAKLQTADFWNDSNQTVKLPLPLESFLKVWNALSGCSIPVTPLFPSVVVLSLWLF